MMVAQMSVTDASLVTPETMACPSCGYDVRGLPEPRCPECGLGFEWGDVGGPPPELFEGGRDHLVPRYLRTQQELLRPRLFFRRYRGRSTFTAGRAGTFLAVSLTTVMIVSWGTFFAFAAVCQQRDAASINAMLAGGLLGGPTYTSVPTFPSPGYWRDVARGVPWRPFAFVLLVMGGAAFEWLAMQREALRRVGWRRAARAFAYAMDPFIGLVGLALFVGVQVGHVGLPRLRHWGNELDVGGCLVAGAWLLWSTVRGYFAAREDLGLPNPGLWSLSAMAVGVGTAVVAWSLLSILA